MVEEIIAEWDARVSGSNDHVDVAYVRKGIHPISGASCFLEQQVTDSSVLPSFDCSGLLVEVRTVEVTRSAEPILTGVIPTTFSPLDPGLLNIAVAEQNSMKSGSNDPNAVIVPETSDLLFSEFEERGVLDKDEPVWVYGFETVPERFKAPEPGVRVPQIIMKVRVPEITRLNLFKFYLAGSNYAVRKLTHGGNFIFYIPMIAPVFDDERWQALFNCWISLMCRKFKGGYTIYSSRSTPVHSPEICLIFRDCDISEGLEKEWGMLDQCLTSDSLPLAIIKYDPVLTRQLHDYYQKIFNRSKGIGKKHFDMARAYEAFSETKHCEHCDYSIYVDKPEVGAVATTIVDVASTNLRCAITAQVSHHLLTSGKRCVWLVGCGTTTSGLEAFKGIDGIKLVFIDVNHYSTRIVADKLKGRTDLGDYVISTRNLNCSRIAQSEFRKEPPDIIVCNFSLNYMGPFLAYCRRYHSHIPIAGIGYFSDDDFEQRIDGNIVIKSRFMGDHYEQYIPSYSAKVFNEPVLHLDDYRLYDAARISGAKRVEVVQVLSKYKVLWHNLGNWNMRNVPKVPARFFNVHAPSAVAAYDSFMKSRGFQLVTGCGVGLFAPQGYNYSYRIEGFGANHLYLTVHQRSVVSHYPFMYMQYVMGQLQDLKVVRWRTPGVRDRYIQDRVNLVRATRANDHG